MILLPRKQLIHKNPTFHHKWFNNLSQPLLQLLYQVKFHQPYHLKLLNQFINKKPQRANLNHLVALLCRLIFLVISLYIYMFF
ncbi:hypothetical protein BJ944DRAFT_264256 [Cunninghamella echinulata]|nr:hypothetical protein BJ944DRAFT_264256 [Cunninghamella echinulata]